MLEIIDRKSNENQEKMLEIIDKKYWKSIKNAWNNWQKNNENQDKMLKIIVIEW